MSAKKKDIPARTIQQIMLADAQKRAQAFNAEERLTEQGAELLYLLELTRLQRKKIKELTQSVRVLLAHAEGTRTATATQLKRARWRLEH